MQKETLNVRLGDSRYRFDVVEIPQKINDEDSPLRFDIVDDVLYDWHRGYSWYPYDTLKVETYELLKEYIDDELRMDY